jgi:hypothetical protein
MGTVFGAASLELSQMLGERVGYWRLKQSIRLAKKAKKMLDEEGLTPQQVPLRTAVPLLEAGSLEEDDDLVGRWASLLANASGGTTEVPPSFANVLREIEPAAAQLLDAIYAGHMSLSADLRPHYSVVIEDIREEAGLSDEAFAYHLDNLIRLGLIRSGSMGGGPEMYTNMSLTAFGRSFVRACKPPGEPDPPIRWSDREKLNEYIRERERTKAERAAKRTASRLASEGGSRHDPAADTAG